MKVLMFGWEFPPHITGGLGTACFGLTKALKEKGVEILFVVPKAYGDEDNEVATLIGANKIQLTQSEICFEKIENKKIHFEKTIENQLITQQNKIEKTIDGKTEITYIEVESHLLPYLSPEQFEKIMIENNLDPSKVFYNEFGQLTYKEEAILKKEFSETTDFQKEEDKPFGYINFTGGYGSNLFHEVSNYAVIASIIAKNNEFDVIHAHDWLTYGAGIAAKKASGKPLVIHVHATEFDRSGENVHQFVYDLEKMGMEAADKVITVSNLTRQTVIQRYGISPEKVETVYNAVEPVDSALLDTKKNVKEKIVTFLGRITFQKGPEYFVEAAYKVLQKTPNVRFVMAGSGDMLNKMIRRAAKLGITSKFHFTGFLKGEDVDRLFAMSDVYVMPSVSEPFGISPLEAMRSNVPVIISKQSGVSEILQHALKVDFWDIDAIADAIYALVNYKALSETFKSLGKQEVDNLQWINAAEEIKHIYNTTN